MEPEKDLENETVEQHPEPEVNDSAEPVVDDRPEKNYKAEIERKNREIERLRQEAEAARNNGSQRRDPADLTTWTDHELKAVMNSSDPSFLAYKDQASDILFERKVQSIREKERIQEKRAYSDLELRKDYPEALDPTSQFATRMEEVMYQYDLQKSPAGRLAAAKIVAAELGKGRSKTDALERKNEESRLRDVRAHSVDGDRSKPQETNRSPKKVEELENRIIAGDPKAVAEALKDRGISRNNFFNRSK